MLFTEDKSNRGEWAYPALVAPPGVFVEECAPGESILSLTEAEFAGPLAEARAACKASGWTRVGFEAGRSYYDVSFKAHVADFPTLVNFGNWRLGDGSPGATAKRWAVEFSMPGTSCYVRRGFWVETVHSVPVITERPRAFHPRRREGYIARRARIKRERVYVGELIK